ncbi:HEL2 E3 ubiquitin-protein ligase HEL2 [Candida maltosa Xu316]
MSTTTTTTSKRSRVHRGGKQPQSQGSKPRGYNKKSVNGEKEVEEEEDIPEGEQCIICAEKIDIAALTPCNHTTCHKCTFRQRGLYEKNICLICRSENERVVMTDEIDKDYDQIQSNDIIASDEKYKIDFTSKYAEEETLGLLENKCSICDATFPVFKELIDHAKEAHGKYYCLICSKFKKAFKIELPLYTYKSLQRHQSEGDGEDSGFTGHPACKYCQGKRFYSEDELNVHIRDRHERCHICDQTNRKNADYFKNYDNLYYHFTKKHFVCSVASCIEKRFVVFRDDLDLTAHMLKEHGGITGSNNRVVIGSNSHHFSQLSTFDRRNTGWMGEDDETSQQSPEIKKRRFEERAKHYLNYNQQKFDEFHSLNNSFKNKSITASELLNLYKQDLFVHQSQEELNLLIKEFQEFFPANSDLYKDLSTIVKENVLEFENPRDQFPVLGGSRSGSSMGGNPSWVATSSNNRSGSPSSGSDKFPALVKPAKKTVINPTSQPIRYTTILKPQPQKKKATILNISQAQSNYKPNYLDKKPSSPALSSITNSINSSGSSSLVSSRNGSSTTLVDDKKFPTLQKKQTKKIIPRVNEVKIADPNSWGKPQEPQPLVSSSSEFDGIDIVDKRKQKMKKKQDRLLFSNAF